MSGDGLRCDRCACDHHPAEDCVQRAALARIEESAEASATPLDLAVAGLVPAHDPLRCVCCLAAAGTLDPESHTRFESRRDRLGPPALVEDRSADLLAATLRVAVLERALEEVVKALGPSAPDCGCDGCEAETTHAYNAARAVLAAGGGERS